MAGMLFTMGIVVSQIEYGRDLRTLAASRRARFLPVAPFDCRQATLRIILRGLRAFMLFQRSCLLHHLITQFLKLLLHRSDILLL